MVAGEFNTDLVQTEGVEQDKEIAAALAVVGLEYMLAHFLM